MPVSIVCPNCNCKLKARDDRAGHTLSCPRCKSSVAIPSTDSNSTPPSRRRDGRDRDDAGQASAAHRRRTRSRDDEDDRDDAPSAPPVRSRGPAILLAAVAVVLVVGAVLIFIGWEITAALLNRPAQQAVAPLLPPVASSNGDNRPNQEGGRPPDAQQTVDAPRLLNAYLSSNTSATEAYTGKILDVRGVVVNVTRDASNSLVVALNGTEPRGLGVVFIMLARYEQKAGGLRRGQAVTIRGRCDGKGRIIDPVDQAANVVVADAHLIEVHQEQKPPEPGWIEPPSTASHDNVHLAVKAVESGRIVLHIPQGISYIGDARIREVSIGGQKALSSGKYLAIRLELTNASGHQVLYYHPAPSAIRLTDERGNVFRVVQDVQVAKEVALPKDSPLIREQMFVLGMRQASLMHERDKALDVLLFDATNLGKGKQLLLELPGTVFANHVPGQSGLASGPLPDKVRFRIDQAKFTAFRQPAIDQESLRTVTSSVIAKALRDGNAVERFLAAKSASVRAKEFAVSFEGQLIAGGLAERLKLEPEDEVRVAVAEALGEVGAAALATYHARKGGPGQGTASVVYGIASRGLSVGRFDPSEAVRTAVAKAMTKCRVSK